MTILITGSTGLLGQALCRQLASSGEVVGVSRHAPPPSLGGRHVVCDLTEPRRTAEVVRSIGPQAVIHAQALSDVDRCEREPALADAQNVRTVANLIEALAPASPLLVFVSTDYVFDGTKGAVYDEADEPRPISVYGRSKLAGEQAALGYRRGIVVRPSTLFGIGRMNFCERVARAALEGGTVEAFTDQTTSPTFTGDAAEAIEELVAVLLKEDARAPRIYHVANTGSGTRLELAHRIVDLLGRSRECVRPIRMAQQQRPAPRPSCSALTTRALPTVIGRRLRPWDDALQAYLRQARWLN